MDNKTLIAVGLLVLGFVGGYVINSYSSNSSWGGMMGREGMQANIDRHFIEQMIPHHEGAIEMATLALEKSTRPEVLSLAKGIIEAQTAEITQMKSWYGTWFGGEPVARGHGMHMDGMTGDIEVLKNSADFDKEFLEQMIPHHEMAIMMANMLAAGTERDEMKTLADQIITSQSKEIGMMRSWLAAW